jgi:peptide/nickel transport system substrate-binding protein
MERLTNADSLMSERYSRRQLLRRAAVLGVSMPVVGSLLLACGDDDDVTEPDTDPVDEPDDDDDGTPEPDDDDDEPEDDDTADAPEGERYGGVLRYGTLGNVDFGSLDMTTTTGTFDLEIGRALNDAYVHMIEGEEFVPGLAESWEISDDALEYTFKLREDIVFHDGTQLDAEAAKYNFDRMTNRETNPGGISYSYLGAGATYGGCDVIDDYTFRLTMTEPNAIFMFRMRRRYVAPQSPTAIEEHGEEYFRNPVGVGPFKLLRWEEDSEVVLEAFEDYNWGPPEIFENTGRPYLDQVVHRIFRDLSTKATALEAGELDLAARLLPEDIIRLQDDPDIEVVIRDQTGQATFLSCNIDRYPTSEVEVREAIAWAIDREALTESIFFGLEVPAYHVFTPDMWSYDASLEDLFGFDPDRSIQVLEDAGWEVGNDGIREREGERLELLYILDELTLPVGQFIQAQLLDVGIGVQLETLAGAGLLEAQLAGQHHITGGMGGWIQEDPDVLRNWIHSSLIGVRQNYTLVNDPELDQLLEDGLKFVGDIRSPEREALYQQAQAMILEPYYVVPLYYRHSFEAHWPYVNVDSIGYDPYGTYHDWNDVWIDESRR